MVFTDQDVKQLLQEALQQAQSQHDKGNTTQQINMNRSQCWVEALAEQFKKRYEGDSEIRVFSKSDPSHRKDFGLNEMLYDILVCRVGEVESSIHKKKLCFIKEVLWQVESEFAQNSRSTLVDSNKLVLGSGKNKLFTCSQVRKGKENSFLSVLQPAAKYCTGDVYVCMVPHPSKWVNGDIDVHLWIFKK
ncbi:hypothetical protein ACFLXO_04520 [Chloroflexota bacterium]